MCFGLTVVSGAYLKLRKKNLAKLFQFRKWHILSLKLFLPIAKILNVKNAQAWVSMVFTSNE